MQLFLQLYSLRRESAIDAEGMLTQVAALGFDGVELAGDYGWSADKWRKLLDETGLKVAGAHVGLEALEDHFEAVLNFQRRLKNTRLVVPSLGGNLKISETYRDAAARLMNVAAKVQAAGFSLLYHNHAFEFEPLPEGGRGMDILLAETTSPEVRFEMDTHWIEVGGEDAAAFLKWHAARIGMIHAKDLRKRDGADVPAGQGDVDFGKIVPMAVENGWPVIVEYEGKNAVAAVRESANYLAGL